MTTIDDYNVQHLLTAVVAKLGAMFGPDFINDVERLYEAFNTPDDLPTTPTPQPHQPPQQPQPTPTSTTPTPPPSPHE